MSAESGISTFRDAGGLWENYPVMEVASHDGYVRNPALVHDFYNKRRHDLINARPNAGHLAIAELERDFDVWVITQNVDDLHERAGSSHVLHLHGELMKVRSVKNEDKLFTLSAPMLDTTPDTLIEGEKVRPHIVFFQEAVPNMEPAAELAAEADIFVIVGTSLAVYPAANLLHYVRHGVPVYYIDPKPAPVPDFVKVIPLGASEGIAYLTEILENQK